VNDQFKIGEIHLAKKDYCSITGFNYALFLHNIYEVRISSVYQNQIEKLELWQEFLKPDGPYRARIDFEYHNNDDMVLINIDKDNNNFSPIYENPFYTVILKLTGNVLYSFQIDQIINGEEVAYPSNSDKCYK